MSRPERKQEYRSDFQKWINTAIDKRGITLTALAAIVEADYSHIWKIARGDTSKYPNSKRPGYKLTEAIGKAVRDVEGAMVAAGYWEIDASAPRDSKPALDPDALVIAATMFRGLSDVQRASVQNTLEATANAMVQSIYRASNTVGVTPAEHSNTKTKHVTH